MKQMTIKELSMIANKCVKDGYGDRMLVISDDNEGNGFHGLFYGITVKDIESYKDLIYDSTTDDMNKIAILG